MVGASSSRNLVVEFTGLPGSGKTTVAALFPDDWFTRHRMPDADVPIASRFELYRNSWRFHRSLRPRQPGDLRKFWRLADQLSYYTTDFGRPLVIDQGVIQRIWSCLVWREEFDHGELERLVAYLAPMSANLVVWFKLPLEESVRRIASRPHGRSRFDRRPLDEIRAELSREERNFGLLVDLFRQHSKMEVIEVSGQEAPEALAAEIIAHASRLAAAR